MRYEYERVKLDKNNFTNKADMSSHREVIDRKEPLQLAYYPTN